MKMTADIKIQCSSNSFAESLASESLGGRRSTVDFSSHPEYVNFHIEAEDAIAFKSSLMAVATLCALEEGVKNGLSGN